MKKLLFIGAIALVAAFAFSSCAGNVTKDDVKAFKEAKDCDAKVKVVQGWEGKKDFDEDAKKEFTEAMKELDLDCVKKIGEAADKIGGEKKEEKKDDKE